MTSNTIDHFLWESVFFQNFYSKINMRSFFICDDLTDIMEQTTELDQINIKIKFVGQGNANPCFFKCMGNHILSVRITIFKFT